MADKNPSLGAWESERELIEQPIVSGRGSDDGASDLLRFRRAVQQVVLRREKHSDAEYDRPAAFILTSAEWFERAPSNLHREPLLNTGHRKLTGQMHFVSKVVTGWSHKYDGEDADLFDNIESAGADTYPTLVYAPKLGLSTLSWYPCGTVDDSLVEVIDVYAEAPTPDRIIEAITVTHKNELITPDQVSKDCQVWVNAGQGWARKEAEALVQRAVRLTLLGAFPQCSVRAEQPGKEGRTDLEIIEDYQNNISSQIIHHAMLEMKVLREKGSTGKPYPETKITKHIYDGLEQAHTYGKERNFNERLLCCFDMRAVNLGYDAVFDSIKDDAKKLDVYLGHWFLYRSSKHLRQCKVQEALMAAKKPQGSH